MLHPPSPGRSSPDPRIFNFSSMQKCFLTVSLNQGQLCFTAALGFSVHTHSVPSIILEFFKNSGSRGQNDAARIAGCRHHGSPMSQGISDRALRGRENDDDELRTEVPCLGVRGMESPEAPVAHEFLPTARTAAPSPASGRKSAPRPGRWTGRPSRLPPPPCQRRVSCPWRGRPCPG